jgi:hypothetical protein
VSEHGQREQQLGTAGAKKNARQCMSITGRFMISWGITNVCSTFVIPF